MKKPERSEAVAHLPSVVLGNHGSKWSLEVEVKKGEILIGRFFVARGGIEFRTPNAKKPRQKNALGRDSRTSLLTNSN
jgi:hypothetical protein